MNIKIKSIYLVTVISLLSLNAYADDSSSSSSTTPSSASSSSSFTGNYKCQRTDASGTTTSDTLAITNSGKVYSFEWDSANGYPVLYGTGVMHPNKDNLITLSFSDPKNADNFGAEFFELKSDGSLQANWVVQSANQLGSETCTKS